MSLWTKTHKIVKLLFPNYVWDIPTQGKTVYLTFDDGPIPEVTEWVLSELEKYSAKATFFCIGNNVKTNPEIYERVRAHGHQIGNHTYNHLNGWKTTVATYLDNVKRCEEVLESGNTKMLLRPPYGRIKGAQSRLLRKAGYKIIMWDVVSFDFDQSIRPEKCLQNVLKNVMPGSIIVFHDSVKAYGNLKYVLPKTLQYLKENGYECASIS